MSRILNRSECAEFFSVAPKTIDEWLAAGMPYVAKPERKGQSGWKIDPGQVLAWHRERERVNALGEVAKVDEQEAKRRKIAAECALIEYNVAVKTGSAVAIGDAVGFLAGVIGSCRARLLPLGAKLGPLVAIETSVVACQGLIDAGVREALQELSEYQPDRLQQHFAGAGKPMDGGPEGSLTMGASAETDR